MVKKFGKVRKFEAQAVEIKDELVNIFLLEFEIKKQSKVFIDWKCEKQISFQHVQSYQNKHLFYNKQVKQHVI